MIKNFLDHKKAMLFDLDGTLVDSMWMWEAIDIEFLGAYGYECPEDLQRAIEGMSFSETAVYFKERFKLPLSLDEIKAYNRMLADQRKAAKAAAEQAASAPAEIPAKAEVPAKPATKPAKKASKPTAPKSAKKPAAQPSAPQKAAQPAPDALHKAERKACAAFLAVPETDRKGQAAALDAWRKTRKAVEDAKSAPAAVAVLDEAPVKQLDFESIAAGLLA